MAPPPLTANLQHRKLLSCSTSQLPPTTTPPPSNVSSNNQVKTKDKALLITTVENAATCGWYSGAISQPFECSTSLSCATNTNNVIACSKKGDKSAFFSDCVDLINANPEDCGVSGVLCCSSLNPSCMTLLWTATPTGSLIGCDAIASTWVMLDYPFDGDDPTSTSPSGDPTSTSPSSMGAIPSNTSQPPATGGTHSSESGPSSPPNSPTFTSLSSSGSHIVTPAPNPSLSTYAVTTLASSSASGLPVTPAPSGDLSTGAEAGIGIGASIGILSLVLIGVFLIKKRQAKSTAQPEESQDGTNGPLQDNPSGELPADIAPPARIARSLSTGWVGSANDEYNMLEGASEVPVDMRGQGVGAVELPGSPVETAPLGVSQSQYDEYQTQASQYRRYSHITRHPQGPVSYRGPTGEYDSLSGLHI